MALLCVLGTAFAPCAAAPAQPAQFAIEDFQVHTTRGEQPPGYEPEPYEFDQAGGHPFAISAGVRFPTEATSESATPVADPKDVLIDLPPGLIADPQAVPRCSQPPESACPSASQIGTYVLTLGFNNHQLQLLGQLVNLIPGPGEAARLGMETPLGRFMLGGQLVRAPAGYALQLAARGLPLFGITELRMTLWGVPAASAHDAERGLTCLRAQAGGQWSCQQPGGEPSGVEEQPFLSLPASCPGTALTLAAWADSWQQPGTFVAASASLPPVSGCDRLPFAAGLSLRPDSWLAEAPVALDLELEVEQSSAVAGIASAQLQGASVTLPAGLTIDPSVAARARGCPPSGSEGIDIPTGLNAEGKPLEPDQLGEGEAPGPGGEPRLSPGHCPDASTIGTAEAESPLLPRPLQGRVYLGTPACGGAGQAPCSEADAADGDLLRVYLELGGRSERDDQGVLLKLEGRIRVSPATGQLTLVLSQAPQLPLSHLAIELFGGSGALLDNPASCAPASASAQIEPWSVPYTPDLVVGSSYRASGCQQPVPFAPRLLAGSIDAAAGAFTAFTVSLSRGVREQGVSQLQLRAPLGIAAMLASVAPCPGPAAAAGACPTGARVGSASVAVGNGYQPLWLSGDAYLTGAYEGAPFGLAIVVHASAGPLDLGQLVIRARLDVDPRTAALTITSDPLPQIVLGVPLRLRELRLSIDRPGFIVNPTDCRGQQVLAEVASAEGAIAAPANPFGLYGCRALGFAPRLSASTSAAAGIAGGASLDVRVAQAAGPGSGQANLARLRIALPRRFSTRLTALQASCPARLFAAEAAACPPGSVVGVARASTPLLSGSLIGPVYLVSHGRSGFPAPVVVLQGGGLRIDLEGRTAIERGGRTAIAFDALPDMPLRSVELYLPRGPHSALVASGGLCPAARASAATLGLPLELAAHNGIVLHRTAKVAVLGCPVARGHVRRQRNSA